MTAALIAGTALHAGFQLTVTVLVYPALFRVPARDWPAAHARHSRAITPLVALVYGSATLVAVVAVIREPSAGRIVALAGTVAAGLVTAGVAAPAHGALGRGRTPGVIARLRVADAARTIAAVVACAGALVSAA